MKFVWHSKLNHAGMYIAVSYPTSGLSPLLISGERISFISYYYLRWYLLVYYGSGEPSSSGTPPSSWPCIITQQLVRVQNLIPPPPLVIFSMFYCSSSGFSFFYPLIIVFSDSGQSSYINGLYGVLESLDVFTEHMVVLMIEWNGFQYLHGEKSDT